VVLVSDVLVFLVYFSILGENCLGGLTWAPIMLTGALLVCACCKVRGFSEEEHTAFTTSFWVKSFVVVCVAVLIGLSGFHGLLGNRK